MHPLIRFISKALLLAAPLLLVVGSYLVWDPFRVLYRYDFGDYYDQFLPVELNRDVASLAMFRKNYPEQRYDSFILGSSRSFPFHCDAWQRYLPPSSRPFHYPAASENLLGIAAKLRYLDAQGVRLNNVLIELASSALNVTPRYDVTHRLPYQISGESWLDFQSAMLGAYLTGDFYFAKYGSYKLTGQIRPFAAGVLAIKPRQVRIDPLTNDYAWADFERELVEDEAAFNHRRAATFPPQNVAAPGCAGKMLGPEVLAELVAIRKLFAKHGTDFRLFIPPMYDEVCINPEDARRLREILGADRVFDFSGRSSITSDTRNFYDPVHLRPQVAERLLAVMYAGRSE